MTPDSLVAHRNFLDPKLWVACLEGTASRGIYWYFTMLVKATLVKLPFLSTFLSPSLYRYITISPGEIVMRKFPAKSLLHRQRTLYLRRSSPGAPLASLSTETRSAKSG